MKSMFIKIKFYLVSLSFLFMLIFLLTFDINALRDNVCNDFVSLLMGNWFSILSLIMAIIGILCYVSIRFELTGIQNPPYKIKEIKNLNYEYMSFMLTYIIPLVCFDFTNTRYIIIFLILIVMMGFLSIKMEIYYANPIFALFGYKIYRVKIDDNINSDIILISIDYLDNKSSVRWISLDKYIWVATLSNKEKI